MAIEDEELISKILGLRKKGKTIGEIGHIINWPATKSLKDIQIVIKTFATKKTTNFGIHSGGENNLGWNLTTF